MGMAKACSNIAKFKHSEGEDVEQSLEILDKVLSEFEDPDSLPPIGLESPIQGLQSEDDGYMSMNDRRSKYLVGLQTAAKEEVPTTKPFSLQISSESSPPPPPPPPPLPPPPPASSSSPSVTTIPTSLSSSSDIQFTQSLHKIEERISNPNFSTTRSPTSPDHHRNDINSTEIRNDKVAYKETALESSPSLTTLPKTRPLTVIPTRYASLPNSSPPRLLIQPGIADDSILNGGRTVLGINISAVHDAVLRGVARMPESIVNEHPVTIYPGRSSPTKRVSPRSTIQFDRNRDGTRAKNPNDKSSSSPSHDHIVVNFVKKLPSPVESHITPFTIANIPPLKVNQQQQMNINNNKTNFNTKQQQQSDSEDFSDDSLEGVSLPPPPPPPVVPPPPSLSAPATPSKRGCIAWEIMLDDKNTRNKHAKKQSTESKMKSNLIQRSTSISDSTTSLVTTSGNSANCTKSADGYALPEMPICSTEDEATSLHSDSDDVIPYSSGSFNGHGTFVISKGNKKRHALPELELIASNKQQQQELHTPQQELQEIFDIKPSQFSTNIGLPFSRHSIDLGSPQPVQNTINYPRSRLSLDLSSPTSEIPITTHPATNTSISSSRYPEFTTFIASHNGFQAHENNNGNTINDMSNDSSNNGCSNVVNNNLALPIMRVSSLTALLPAQSDEILSTPRRELAPPIEEDEDQDSEVQRAAPLRQIENNISALLRGDIQVARVGDVLQSQRRPHVFRTGVHKSESAKEMLLFQNIFGPLPPSPPSSGTEESDGFPPLPPSPQDDLQEDIDIITNGLHKSSLTPRIERSYRDVHSTDDRPPAIPPHRGPSLNTLKTRSMESEYIKSNRMNGPYTSLHDVQGFNSRRRLMSGAFPKRSIHSPREEKRLQTSCSLPETPIFARGCDVPRTPHRRTLEQPSLSGSRTAPRTTGPNTPNSCVGNTINARQRSISQALAGGELLRQAGGPARGWYPRQRHPRPASTENLNRLHPQGSIRAWDTNTNSRKPLTLPPNLTPKFFNKSPREALRRVTSLLIRKGASNKESKKERDPFTSVVFASSGPIGDEKPVQSQKKKGFFKSFWKKSRHYSLEK